MKTALEVVGFIDEYVFHSLKRPAMYASSPQALEDILSFCDGLRNYIMEVPRDFMGDECTSYSSFLQSKGYGAGTFTDPKKNEGLTNSQVFKNLASHYEEYLKVRGL